jgi:hypothetical protein
MGLFRFSCVLSLDETVYRISMEEWPMHGKDTIGGYRRTFTQRPY